LAKLDSLFNRRGARIKTTIAVLNSSVWHNLLSSDWLIWLSLP